MQLYSAYSLHLLLRSSVSMLLAAHSVVLSERLKRMMKWLRALILKDNLTSLQNHDQNISENIWYFNYNYDDVLSSP